MYLISNAGRQPADVLSHIDFLYKACIEYVHFRASVPETNQGVYLLNTKSNQPWAPGWAKLLLALAIAVAVLFNIKVMMFGHKVADGQAEAPTMPVSQPTAEQSFRDLCAEASELFGRKDWQTWSPVVWLGGEGMYCQVSGNGIRIRRALTRVGNDFAREEWTEVVDSASGISSRRYVMAKRLVEQSSHLGIWTLEWVPLNFTDISQRELSAQENQLLPDYTIPAPAEIERWAVRLTTRAMTASRKDPEWLARLLQEWNSCVVLYDPWVRQEVDQLASFEAILRGYVGSATELKWSGMASLESNLHDEIRDARTNHIVLLGFPGLRKAPRAKAAKTNN